MTDHEAHLALGALANPVRTELVVLDMAGTTVADDGLVERAFRAALPDFTEADLAHVRDTMGESKITVFRHLTGGREERAQKANAAFEAAYAGLVDEGRCAPLPGAEEALRRLREDGRAIALTTGFARDTQDRIITALGWRRLVDLTLCPADVGGRGRPHPDMVLAAALRAQVSSVAAVAVAGDTASDVRTGRNAGAGTVVGVLTGAHDAATLEAAGATHVLGSVAALPDLLTAREG
ncbi:phosphonatase-like hydrolase [Nocardiopsis ganjiahuensis]|uniref:phosphonatase-like hydrolase n=1 Tax=Nocardiopsis ganjiahuensis TaxID=239984 RepID=UPI000686DF17|nr:phosphonatase-like hydrolase [Nocardiopsis ganjiahuensis]